MSTKKHYYIYVYIYIYSQGVSALRASRVPTRVARSFQTLGVVPALHGWSVPRLFAWLPVQFWSQWLWAENLRGIADNVG